jgi:hypothetical protein
MTARQFYDVGADAVSDSPRPLETDYLIFGADNVSTRDGGRFGQRARQGQWIGGRLQADVGPPPSRAGAARPTI